MYVTPVCLTFDERLSFHCNIGGFIIAQEEFKFFVVVEKQS